MEDQSDGAGSVAPIAKTKWMERAARLFQVVGDWY